MLRQRAKPKRYNNDYETQKRTVKSSGDLYADIIKNKGVTDEAYDIFVAPSQYKK